MDTPATEPTAIFNPDRPGYRLTDRTQKLKDARSEAQKDIEAYKSQKDKDFKTFEGTVSSGLTSCRVPH